MKKIILAVIAALLVVAPVMADNAVTDFEMYRVGNLYPQGGWVPSQTDKWTVVGGVDSPMNGNKSVYVNTSGNDCFGPAYISGTTFEDGTVGSIVVRPAGTNGWVYFNLVRPLRTGETGGWNGFIPFAGAYFDGTNINYAVNGYNWADTGYDHGRNKNYAVTVTLNFTTQKYTLGVQDVANPANNFTVSNLSFAAPTTAAEALAGKFYMGGLNAYFDDLSPASGTIYSRYVPYQGKLLSNGQPINGTATVKFELFDAVTGGNVVLTQAASSLTLTNGTFTRNIGPISPYVLSTKPDLWLEVTVNGQVMSPRAKLETAPYAATSYTTAP